MIQFTNVTKKFGKDFTALEDVSFTIDKGSFVYLVGSTGSGKTTIFRLLIRDLIADDGQVTVDDWNINKLSRGKISQLRRKVGVIFQDLKLLMDRTVMENVILPLQFTGVNEKEAKARAEEILLEVGLGDKKDKFPLQLSGGERQRVAIARALIFNPEFLLADEPTGNLDLHTADDVFAMLRDLVHGFRVACLIATHNLEIAKRMDRVVTIREGVLEEVSVG